MFYLANNLHQWLQSSPLLNSTFLSVSMFMVMLFLLWKKTPKYSKNPNLPPSPPTFPIIGNLHQIGSLQHRSLGALSDKYGPIMLMHFGTIPTVVVSSAELAEDVLKTYDHILASRPPMKMAQLLLGSNSFGLAPYGEYWRNVRKICVVHLLSAKQVQSFSPVRDEEVAAMVQKIRASKESVLNLNELFSNLVYNTFTRTMLGMKIAQANDGGLKKMLDELVQMLGEYFISEIFPWLGWIDKIGGLQAKAKKLSQKLDKHIQGVLDDFVKEKSNGSVSKESTSFVDVLLSLSKEDNTGGSVRLSSEHIKSIVHNLFVAGNDTSVTVMEWTMTELMRNPEEMKKAQAEVRSIVGAKHYVELEDISKMSFFKATIKESMRLHPPGPLLLPRMSTEKLQLGGYEIPAGMRVLVNAWAINRDRKYWDEPEEFVPERFVNNGVDFKGQDFHFLPFGSGRRMCPGISFGVPIVELTLANMLFHFEWKLPNGMKEEELDMTESSGLSPHKKSNLLLLAKPRDV